MKVRIKFKKYGVMKFIGHLDVMRYFQKVMRRADIPIAFTKGFSPHMIMSFAQPLGVGVTSDGEYFDIELTKPVSTVDALKRMNRVMVEGIEVTNFVEIPDEKKYSGMTMVAGATYEVTLLKSAKSAEETIPVADEWCEKTEEFLDQIEIPILKKTKRSEKEVDIKPMIYNFTANHDKFQMFLATGSEQNLKPDLVMKAFFDFIGIKEQDIPLHIHRVDVYAKSNEDFLPLDAFGKDINVADM